MKKTNIILAAIMVLGVVKVSYAETLILNCDSTCMPANPSMVDATSINKVNISSTTYNAGTVSWGGVCGSSNGLILQSAPTSQLCSSGLPSTVVSSGGKYTWSCTGNNGAGMQCSADQAVLGSCGSDNGNTLSYPVNLCSAGTASAVNINGNIYTWTCSGNYGVAASCSAIHSQKVCSYNGPTNAANDPHDLTLRTFNGRPIMFATEDGDINTWAIFYMAINGNVNTKLTINWAATNGNDYTKYTLIQNGKKYSFGNLIYISDAATYGANAWKYHEMCEEPI